MNLCIRVMYFISGFMLFLLFEYLMLDADTFLSTRRINCHIGKFVVKPLPYVTFLIKVPIAKKRSQMVNL